MTDSNDLPEELRIRLFKDLEAVSKLTTEAISTKDYVKGLKTLEKNLKTAIKRGTLKEFRDKYANQIEVSKSKISEVSNATTVSSQRNDSTLVHTSRRPTRAAAIKATEKTSEAVNLKLSSKLRRPSEDVELPPKKSVRLKNKQYAGKVRETRLPDQENEDEIEETVEQGVEKILEVEEKRITVGEEKVIGVVDEVVQIVEEIKIQQAVLTMRRLSEDDKKSHLSLGEMDIFEDREEADVNSEVPAVVIGGSLKSPMGEEKVQTPPAQPQVSPSTKKLTVRVEKLSNEILKNFGSTEKKETGSGDRSSGYSSRKSVESEKKRSRSRSQAEDQEARLEELQPAAASSSSPNKNKKKKKNDYSSPVRTLSPLQFKLVIDLADEEGEIKEVEKVEEEVPVIEEVTVAGETKRTRTKAKKEAPEVVRSPSPVRTRKARTKAKKKEETIVLSDEGPSLEDVENNKPEEMGPPPEVEQSSRPARTKVIKRGPNENINLPVIGSNEEASPVKKTASPVRTRTKVREMAKKIEESSELQKAQTEVMRSTIKKAPDTIEGKENSKARGVHEWDSCRKGTPLQTNNRIYTPISSAPKSQHILVSSETKSKTLMVIRTNEERKRKEEEQARKLKKEEDARRKREEMMRQVQEATRRKREEKIQKATAAREAVEREREEVLARQEREREEREAAARLEKARTMEETALKKRQLNLTKAQEVEERRLKEEQARQQRLKEQEEEQKRLAEIRLKQHEEAEKLFQQRQVEELRLKEAQKKQKLQMDKLKTKALAAEACVSYTMTPPKSERIPLPPKTEEDYGIDDIGSGDSSDEEANPKKKIPAWALKNLVEMQIKKQSFVMLDLRLKYMSCKNKSPDMGEIFGNKLPKRVRTSSAVWLRPMLYK